MRQVRSREERRLRREQAVRESIDGIMHDTRYDRLRGRRVRRGLVVLYVVLLVSLLPAYVAWTAIGGTAVVVVGIVVLALLRQATRVVADAPPEFLDERQRTLQARTYLVAYRVVGSVVALASLAAFGAVIVSPDPDTATLLTGVDAVSGTLLTAFGVVLAAPTCVYAWEQELT